MTRYNADDYSDWELRVHRLLGKGYGSEDIAIKLACDIEVVCDQINQLRKRKMVMTVIKYWSKPAITYGGK